MKGYASAWNHRTVRELEADSIRAFVESCSDQLGGRVLDYGCGRQPYRDVVERAGGVYQPFDRASFPANVSGEDVGDDVLASDDFDAILATQILQYVEDPMKLLAWFRRRLLPDGHLVLTYATCWDEVEPADLHRFTRWGVDRLLWRTGFEVVRNERRAEIELGGFRFPLGGGALARRPG